jgi:hypothetical protein
MERKTRCRTVCSKVIRFCRGIWERVVRKLRKLPDAERLEGLNFARQHGLAWPTQTASHWSKLEAGWHLSPMLQTAVTELSQLIIESWLCPLWIHTSALQPPHTLARDPQSAHQKLQPTNFPNFFTPTFQYREPRLPTTTDKNFARVGHRTHKHNGKRHPPHRPGRWPQQGSCTCCRLTSWRISALFLNPLRRLRNADDGR